MADQTIPACQSKALPAARADGPDGFATAEPPPTPRSPDDREGLVFDLVTMIERARERSASSDRLIDRRRLLAMIGGGAAATALLAACQWQVTGGGYTLIPHETAGPYPGDGSNGPNVLTTSGIVRSDITSSFGGMSGTAAGFPLTITMKVLDASDGYTEKAGLAVYVWHCDQNGNYSLYSPAVTNQNYLRGVQVTDEYGNVQFQSIFPACYSGRWPHIHFEVYPDLASATSSSNAIATSQMALPEDVCANVYNNVAGYSSSVANLARVSLATDNVFSDGWTNQLVPISGDLNSRYWANFIFAVT